VAIAAGAIVIAIVVCATALALWRYRAAALDQGERHLMNVALALGGQTRQAIRGIDLVLRATAEDYAGSTNGRRLPAAPMHARMTERLGQVPQLRSLVIVDAAGRLVVNSREFPPPAVSYADREYFKALRDGGGSALYVGEPVVGRTTGEQTRTLSRRIEAPGGAFLGVATASLNLAYFHDLYRSIDIGAAGRVFVFRRDGIVLTTYPVMGTPADRSMAAHELFSSALSRSDHGVVQAAGLADTEERLVAYEALKDYPVVIAVSSTRDHVLQDWRRAAWEVGTGMVGVVAFMALGLFLVGRQYRIGESLAAEVDETDRRWLAAVEAAAHGVWAWDVVAGKVHRSRHYHEILGYSSGEIPEGRDGWLQILHPEDRKKSHQADRACLDGSQDAFSSEIRLRCKDGSWKWVLNRGMVAGRDDRGRALRVLGTITDVTEHRQAQQHLHESEERLNGIIASAMDAIITIDAEQNVVLFNSAAERIFRCAAAEAIGSPLDRFIPERLRAAHRRHVEHFGATGETTRMMGARLALAGLRGDGEEFPIDASISQVAVAGRKLYTVILRDITERERAEAEVHKERDTAQRYLDVAGVILVALDSNGKVTLINRKGCEVLGYREEEIVGQSWCDRFLPEYLRRDTWNVFEQIVAGETQLAEFHENPVLTRSGAERMIAWHNRVVTDENGRIVGTLSSGQDITERKQAEAALERSYRELRELSAAMNEVREAERTRIARELHDELAQWLTALKMDVAWLASRLPGEHRQLLDRTERMKGLVDTTVGAVRRIAAALRPVMLDDLGLVAATENLLHDFSQRTGIIVSHEVGGWADELGEPLATSLYRILQEAVTNVARHAAATEVQVALRREDDDLILRVRDNGRGFDAEVAARRKSYGVLGMRERAHTLGGRARIERLETGGTLVEIVIPYERYDTQG
jgi:hypothetical protein